MVLDVLCIAGCALLQRLNFVRRRFDLGFSVGKVVAGYAMGEGSCSLAA